MIKYRDSPAPWKGGVQEGPGFFWEPIGTANHFQRRPSSSSLSFARLRVPPKGRRPCRGGAGTRRRPWSEKRCRRSSSPLPVHGDVPVVTARPNRHRPCIGGSSFSDPASESGCCCLSRSAARSNTTAGPVHSPSSCLPSPVPGVAPFGALPRPVAALEPSRRRRPV